MLKRLSKEEREPFEPDNEQDLRGARLDWDIEGLLQTQLDSAIKQIVEWGEEDCPHMEEFRLMEARIKDYNKRSCPKCWQELKAEGGE